MQISLRAEREIALQLQYIFSRCPQTAGDNSRQASRFFDSDETSVERLTRLLDEAEFVADDPDIDNIPCYGGSDVLAEKEESL